MSFIKDLLQLQERDSPERLKQVVDTAKDGLKAAQQKRKEAEREVKAKQAEAERKAKEAVRAEEKLKKKEEAEAAKLQRRAVADHKLKTAEAIAGLKTDINTYLDEFFDKFPNQGTAEVRDVLKKYPTRESALAAFKAFRGIAERLDTQRKKLNAALVTANLVKQEQMDSFQAQANKMFRNNRQPTMPEALVNFVQNEARFFKRLITVNDEFKLNDGEFRRLLTGKIEKTQRHRVPDAAQAMNLLLVYMIDQLTDHARVIAAAGRQLDDEGATKENNSPKREVDPVEPAELRPRN